MGGISYVGRLMRILEDSLGGVFLSGFYGSVEVIMEAI
jgi:hypothetical protein